MHAIIIYGFKYPSPSFIHVVNKYLLSKLSFPKPVLPKIRRCKKLDIFLVLFYFIIEEKKAEYLITVVTGNKEGAGTDASATVVIKGTEILLLVFTVTPSKIKLKVVQ